MPSPEPKGPFSLAALRLVVDSDYEELHEADDRLHVRWRCGCNARGLRAAELLIDPCEEHRTLFR